MKKKAIKGQVQPVVSGIFWVVYEILGPPTATDRKVNQKRIVAGLMESPGADVTKHSRGRGTGPHPLVPGNRRARRLFSRPATDDEGAIFKTWSRYQRFFFDNLNEAKGIDLVLSR